MRSRTRSSQVHASPQVWLHGTFNADHRSPPGSHGSHRSYRSSCGTLDRDAARCRRVTRDGGRPNRRGAERSNITPTGCARPAPAAGTSRADATDGDARGTGRRIARHNGARPARSRPNTRACTATAAGPVGTGDPGADDCRGAHRDAAGSAHADRGRSLLLGGTLIETWQSPRRRKARNACPATPGPAATTTCSPPGRASPERGRQRPIGCAERRCRRRRPRHPGRSPGVRNQSRPLTGPIADPTRLPATVPAVRCGRGHRLGNPRGNRIHRDGPWAQRPSWSA